MGGGSWRRELGGAVGLLFPFPFPFPCLQSNTTARGNLILAIQARSFHDYYLYSETNTVQPPNFIGNKVAGILFENKVDHTTYFGAKIEYIQGIHMLPLLPHTPFIRHPAFVTEEWTTYFSDGRADDVVGGWKGILFGNYATIDPRGAFAFFSKPDFDPSWLDGGASLTWYLCYAAGRSFLLFLCVPSLLGGRRKLRIRFRVGYPG